MQVIASRNVGARDSLEDMLVTIWQAELGVANLGIHDNFFDLGGHSLPAARVIAEVQKATGHKIPLSALFRGPTVEQLAAIIRTGSENDSDPVLLQIQQGQAGLPFFAIASPGVEALGYALLARHMPGQTVYKIQGNHRPTSPREPLSMDQLRSLASEYIAAMRAVQPQGPYCIGAMCEGVHIAEKMVVELESQREEVALLAIVDTWVLQNRQVRWLTQVDYYHRKLRSVAQLPLPQQWTVFRQTVRRKLQEFLSGNPGPPDPWAQAYWPGKGFQPESFRAPVLLFKRSKYPYYYANDPELGWGERSLGGVEGCIVNSAHEDMLREPSVRMIAQRLADRLKETSARALNRAEVTLVAAPGTGLSLQQTEAN